MAESIAESARKASAGSWRKPRMKIYDYNQVRVNNRDKTSVFAFMKIKYTYQMSSIRTLGNSNCI